MFRITERIVKAFDFIDNTLPSNCKTMSFIKNIEKKHIPYFGEVEILGLNMNAYPNFKKLVNAISEKVSILCTSDDEVIVIAPIYDKIMSRNDIDVLNSNLEKIDHMLNKKVHNAEFGNIVIDNIIYNSLSIDSRWFTDRLPTFNFCMYGIENIIQATNEIRTLLKPVYEGLIEEERKRKNKLDEEHKRRQEEERKRQQVAKWKNNDLCQHCGSKFKGIFHKRCRVCGIEKDY